MVKITIEQNENGHINVDSEELNVLQMRELMEHTAASLKSQEQVQAVMQTLAPQLNQFAEDLRTELLGANGERLLEAVKGKVAISYEQYLAFQEAVDKGDLTKIDEAMVVTPTYMTDKAVGADAFASEDVTIEPGDIKIVPTGFKAKFPGDDLGLFPFIRSSVPKKKGLMLANGVGVVEEDYFGNPDNDGNVGFMFWNFRSEPVTIKRFERVGQLVLLPIKRFDNAGRAGKERGASGSTGE